MKTERTPGQWDYDATKKYNQNEVIRMNGVIIAVLPHSMTDRDGERQANARLIAAAPEMLDALRTLAEIANKILALSQEYRPGSGYELQQRINKAFAAIAKAEGDV